MILTNEPLLEYRPAQQHQGFPAIYLWLKEIIPERVKWSNSYSQDIVT